MIDIKMVSFAMPNMFNKNDEYMTPFSAWDNIKQFIPRDKVIWEAFKGSGESCTHLQKLGFDVVSTDEDFFTCAHGECIVTNPPFSKKKEVLQRLKELDKPFILIMPVSTLSTQYIKKYFKDQLQIIIPKKRIQFHGTPNAINIKGCHFDCFYFCYKINLKEDITWLD